MAVRHGCLVATAETVCDIRVLWKRPVGLWAVFPSREAAGHYRPNRVLFNIDSGGICDIETSNKIASLDTATGKGKILSLKGSAEYAFPHRRLGSARKKRFCDRKQNEIFNALVIDLPMAGERLVIQGQIFGR